MLGGLAHLCVLQVLLFLQRPGVAHRCNQHNQLGVDDLFDLLVVDSFDALPGGLLVGNKVDELLELSTLRNAEGLVGLHLVKSLVDVHEALQESWPRLNEVTGQSGPSPIVHLESDVALPEGEDLPDDVVL